MSVEAIMHTEFPEGYTVFFGADGKVIMTGATASRTSC